ncbi:hypothetical protein J6X90_02755 [Candidatus Saccharibacteria bacterium]|nr:hypothetical protein [Candidatus Saccharibacteria bacterium]
MKQAASSRFFIILLWVRLPSTMIRFLAQNDIIKPMKIIRYRHNLDFTYALGATLVFELLKTKPESVRRIFIKPTLKQDT